MLTLGIDDAGRGPIIGPMILSGVLLTKEQEEKLKKYKIRDSKTIHNSKMKSFAEIVKANSVAHYITKTFPDEIDRMLATGTNLNAVEAIKTAEIVNSINSKFKDKKIKVIVDCPSHNAFAWRTLLLEKIEHLSNLEVHCEHKADANHVSAGAASILSKNTREEEVAKIKKQYGNIGSGYSHDPETIKFLKENGKKLRDSGIFRKSWSTWTNLFPGKHQSTLSEFKK